MPATLTETLGRFVAESSPSDVPLGIAGRARVSLVHNLVVALAGRGRETVAHRVASEWMATPAEATLLATGARATAEGAAFANGSLFHARSQDDTHPASTSHPGAPVMAAALAVAEAEMATGAQFLHAVILGYEVLCRIGRDFDHLATARGFRSAAIFGPFGAAAAAAKLMGLDADETGHALAMCAHFAGGVAQVWAEGGPEFPMQLGNAARNGVFAARIAKSGGRAGRQMLEGRSGFYRAYAGATDAPVEVLDGLGFDWQFAEVTTKAFPACAILQGPLELTVSLASRQAIAASEVRHVRLALNPYEADYPGVDNHGPAFASPAATKMSAQFCLSVALLERTLKLSDLSRLDDPRIAALAARIEVVRDSSVPERLSRIEIELDGKPAVRGTVETPAGRPDFAGISAFAHMLAPEMGFRTPEVDRLLGQVRSIGEAPGVSGLIDACLRR